MGSKTSKSASNLLIAIIIILILALAAQSIYLYLKISERGDSSVSRTLNSQTVSNNSQDTFAAQSSTSPIMERRDPFAEMDRMQLMMNKLFQTVRTQGPVLAREWQNLSSQTGAFVPNVDLRDNGTEYTAIADIPGAEKDKIEIIVEGQLLTLRGTRETLAGQQSSDKEYYSQERTYGSFTRSIQLPGPVKEDEVTASYENGVLTVSLPKAQTASSRKIKVV